MKSLLILKNVDKEERGTKIRYNKGKLNNKMVYLNPNRSIIILNINDLKNELKGKNFQMTQKENQLNATQF